MWGDHAGGKGYARESVVLDPCAWMSRSRAHPVHGWGEEGEETDPDPCDEALDCQRRTVVERRHGNVVLLVPPKK